MREGYRPEAGLWWRFSEYQVVAAHPGSGSGKADVVNAYDPRMAGEIIVPVPGASLEIYDPFQLSDQEPPYQSLARLAQEVDFDSSGRLREGGAARLVAWCNRFGLLGIVPQTYLSLWGRQDYSRHEEEENVTEAEPIWSHVRGNGEWLTVQGPVPAMEYDYPNDGLRLASFERMAPFFPGLHPQEGADVPLRQRFLVLPDPPLSAPFWHVYGEPVVRFMEWARGMRDALSDLTTISPAVLTQLMWRDPYDEEGNLISDEATRLEASLELLNWLTGSIAPVLTVYPFDANILHPDSWSRGEPELRQVWTFPSLLAAMAWMIVRDIKGSRRVYLCANCGTPFTSSSPKAGYCSVKCRNTAQKRRQRERKKGRRKDQA